MKQLLGICRMPLGRVGVFLLAFLLAIMPMVPAFADNDDIPETMSYEVGDIIETADYAFFNFEVIDADAYTVQLGTGTSNYNGYKDGVSGMAPNVNEDNQIVVPSSVTDISGQVWTVKKINYRALGQSSSTNAMNFYADLIIEADLDYIGSQAFGLYCGNIEFRGSVKEIEGNCIYHTRSFVNENGDAILQFEYPEGSQILYTNGGADGYMQTGGYISFPKSFNGTITQTVSPISCSVKSPYAYLYSTNSLNGSYYGAGSDMTYMYFWADSYSQQCYDNISTSRKGEKYVTPRVMAVLSDVYELTGVTPPEGTADEDIYPTTLVGNSYITGIEDGATYGESPAISIVCEDDEYGWTDDAANVADLVYYDESGDVLNSAPILAGTYSVKIVGNDVLTWGEWPETYTFTIDPNVAGAEVTPVGSTEFVYNGENQAPRIEVTLDGRTLTEGVEYVVSYFGGDDAISSDESPSAPGNYLMMVNSKQPMTGGYLGSVAFTISAIDLEECTVSVDDMVATGSTLSPEIVVTTADGNVVPSNVYSLTYTDAFGNETSSISDAGTYTVTVTGDGIGCLNEASATFTVVEVGHVFASVEETADLVYTGEAVSPAFTVTDEGGNVVAESDYTLTYYCAVDDGEGGYVPGDEVAASELIDGGTYIAVAKPLDLEHPNYLGSAQCVFTIAGMDVADDVSVTVNRTDYDFIPSCYWLDPDTPVSTSERIIYRGEYITPDVTVTLDDGTELVEGVDYTLSCVNNTGDDKDYNSAAKNKWTAAFTVELCGNYSGTIGTIDENNYADSTFVFYISQRQRVYEYKGIRFTYALDNDGNAIITGLDEDLDSDTAICPGDAFTSAWDRESVVIPATINTEADGEHPVIRIAPKAFSSYSGNSNSGSTGGSTNSSWDTATKIVLEEGIQEVGEAAFPCRGITDIELPEGLLVIGPIAFQMATDGVEEIVIPSTVTTIGCGAFGHNSGTSHYTTITFIQPSSFTTMGPAFQFTTQSGSTRVPGEVSSSPFDCGGTDGYAPLSSLTIPASYTGDNQLVTDAVNLLDVYFMADEYTGPLTMSALISGANDGRSTIWGWDIDGTRLIDLVNVNSALGSFEPFAVLGDGYTYTNAWNEETQCCDGEQFYEPNIDLVGADVTTTSDEVVVDWDFEYNYVNPSDRELVEGEDFTVTYVKEGTDEVLDEITEAGTYTATLTGNDINCFGTTSIEIEVPVWTNIDDATVEVVGADNLTYNGTAQQPSARVTINRDGVSMLLAKGVDYELSYANNVYAGTATVTVTGIGLYEGSATATFNIAKVQASVKAADLSKAYGADDPTFIWADVEGLVAGDQLLSATFTRAPGEDAGEYAITMTDAVIVGGGVVVSDCYDITYAPGTLTILPASESATANTMNVYAGDDRYDTASRIASSVAEEGPYAGVIVCSGANGKFADALAASGLSGVLDYPIVLTDGSAATLPADTAQSISALIGGAQANIIVLGGEGTVSSGIYSALSAYGTVDRIAGDDRYATAEAVYEYGTAHGGWSTDYAVLAIGNNFPDALGAASFCTTYGAPMLLTNSNDDSLAGYITEAASAVSEVVIVGGESSVSASKESALKAVCSNVERMAGDSRYDTNVAFASWQIAHGMTADGAGIATGANFPDSLGSSYLLSLTSSVLLLASSDEAENAGLYALLSDNADAVTSVSVLGGPNSVTATTRLATQTTVGGAWVIVNK